MKNENEFKIEIEKKNENEIKKENVKEEEI